MIAFIADRVGVRPTHLAAIVEGRIAALRATCGGRRLSTVADPTGAIRRGEHMQSTLARAAFTVLITRNRSYGAPTLQRLRELLAAQGPGRVGHSTCLDHYNSTMACGLAHGDCGSRACTFSGRSANLEAEAAWLVLNGGGA